MFSVASGMTTTDSHSGGSHGDEGKGGDNHEVKKEENEDDGKVSLYVCEH